MVHTLLLLVICAYSSACIADASLSDFAPEQPATTIPIKSRVVRRKTQAASTVTIKQTPARTYVMTSRKTTVKGTPLQIARPSKIRYTPVNPAQIQAARLNEQAKANDRIKLAQIARALGNYNAANAEKNPEKRAELKARAARTINAHSRSIQNPERRKSVATLLKPHGLSQETLQREVDSHSAKVRLQNLVRKGTVSERDIKSDKDYAKMTPEHRAIIDRQVRSIATNRQASERKAREEARAAERKTKEESTTGKQGRRTR